MFANRRELYVRIAGQAGLKDDEATVVGQFVAGDGIVIRKPQDVNDSSIIISAVPQTILTSGSSGTTVTGGDCCVRTLTGQLMASNPIFSTGSSGGAVFDDDSMNALNSFFMNGHFDINHNWNLTDKNSWLAELNYKFWFLAKDISGNYSVAEDSREYNLVTKWKSLNKDIVRIFFSIPIPNDVYELGDSIQNNLSPNNMAAAQSGQGYTPQSKRHAAYLHPTMDDNLSVVQPYTTQLGEQSPIVYRMSCDFRLEEVA